MSDKRKLHDALAGIRAILPAENEPAATDWKLVPVEPQPDYIESSGRWRWPLPEHARFEGCSTEVVTASREWWEYCPSEAKPHPMSQAAWVRDVWYWMVPAAAHDLTELRALATRIFTQGYMHGHNDTVESCFTDIKPQDEDDYFADLVVDLSAYRELEALIERMDHI